MASPRALVSLLSLVSLTTLLAACSDSSDGPAADTSPAGGTGGAAQAGAGGSGQAGATSAGTGGASAAGTGGSSATGGSAAEPEEAVSTMARNTAPNVPASDASALVAGNTAFALDFYHAVGAGTNAGQNLFFSPYSISLALAMTYAGAGGTTATQMASALHFTLPEAQLNPAFDALDLALQNLGNAPAPNGGQPLTLHIVNSMWGEKTEAFRQPFLDALGVNFGTGVYLVDFKNDPDGSRGQINTWVADQTDQKILNLLGQGTITESTRFVLADAIYFNASWDTPFDTSRTQTKPFTRDDGTQVQVATMENAQLTVPYVQGNGYQAVELPYVGDSVVMDVILPAAGTFDAFEAALTSDQLTGLLSGLQGTGAMVDLSLPKFGYSGLSISLKTILQGLGMTAAFDPSQANFSAVAVDPDGPIYLTDVIHKAYLSVDESGTEAAAATAVIAGVGLAIGGPEPMITVVNVNSPFLFVLRDVASGTILFAGRILDPSAS